MFHLALLFQLNGWQCSSFDVADSEKEIPSTGRRPTKTFACISIRWVEMH
jgi:hypothetical protein